MKRAALILVLVACSKSKPAAPVRGSCQSGPSVCEEYESTDPKYVARQEAGCAGSWQPAACPPANIVGSCREARGWIRTRHYYRGVEGQANPAVEKAKAECGAYGTWLEPR